VQELADTNVDIEMQIHQMQKGNKGGSQLSSSLDKTSFLSQSTDLFDLQNTLELGGQDFLENKKRGRQ
jgi:hypothetical protein